MITASSSVIQWLSAPLGGLSNSAEGCMSSYLGGEAWKKSLHFSSGRIDIDLELLWEGQNVG